MFAVHHVAFQGTAAVREMRIHYLVTSMERGGAEFSIPDIATVLRNLGHEFHVFACEPRDRMAEPGLRRASVPLTVLSNKDASKLGSIYRYANVVRKSRPDLIWTSLSHATLVGQAVGALFGIPVVSWKHSADAKRYIRWSQRLSKLWIADSCDVATYLQDTMGVGISRIATWPIFSPKFSPVVPDRWDGRGAFKIGSVGRLHPQKNYDLLCHALDRLRREDPVTFAKIEVSIAGDGPQHDALRNLIVSLDLQRKVELVGWKSDVTSYLRGLHLYVQPSAYEGMCIAAHEAMAAGLPVLATPVGEMRRSVQPGVTGMLIEGDVVTGIVAGIKTLIQHPEALETLGAEGRNYLQRTMGAGAFEKAGREVMQRIESEVLRPAPSFL
jgi:glycosyltransferase involved in cell wall biosynthesis